MEITDSLSIECETILRNTLQSVYCIITSVILSPFLFTFLSFKQRPGYSPFMTSTRAVKAFKKIFVATEQVWHLNVFSEWSRSLYVSAISSNGIRFFLVYRFCLKCCSRWIMYFHQSFRQIVYVPLCEALHLISSILHSWYLPLTLHRKQSQSAVTYHWNFDDCFR